MLMLLSSIYPAVRSEKVFSLIGTRRVTRSMTAIGKQVLKGNVGFFWRLRKAKHGKYSE